LEFNVPFQHTQYVTVHVGDQCLALCSLPVTSLTTGAAVSEEFQEQILSHFNRSSASGELCKLVSNPLTYGSRLYESIVAKRDKAVEVRKCVMSDMRRIASLFLEFKKLIPDSSRTSAMLC